MVLARKHCGHEVIKGGRFLWKCIREPHKDDRPNSHVYEVVKEIAEKTST